ncbi:MAG: trypsin-like peptidase domain-containing protein [Anaerolineae bacterium]|nr:trypsin-like peptidase domain-containing protein [Anaerolineae bacterium]
MQDRRLLLGIAIAMLVLLGCTCISPTATLVSPSTPVVVVVTATPRPDDEVSPDPVMLSTASLAQEQVVIDIYKRVAPAVVFVEMIDADSEEGGGSGAGFVYDTEGRIVTNAHVVSGADLVRVYFSDDTVAKAEILGFDLDSDLAVLQVNVPAEILQPVEIGSSEGLQVGQLAIAIGNPYGYERTLTVGYISALGRVLRQESNFSVAEVIQTDASINPGNSGGPLLDSKGLVIGVNSYYRPSSPLGGSVGIGFAIPSDLVKLVVPELITHGRYRHPWLGVSGYALLPEMISALNLSVEHGALVATVVEDSPSARAGVRGGTDTAEVPGYPEPIPVGGDIIIQIGDIKVHGMDDIITYLQRTRVGEQIILTIVRDGKEMTIPVELGERPER